MNTDLTKPYKGDSSPGKHTQQGHASKNWITVPMGTANEGYAHDFYSGLHTQSFALQP